VLVVGDWPLQQGAGQRRARHRVTESFTAHSSTAESISARARGEYPRSETLDGSTRLKSWHFSVALMWPGNGGGPAQSGQEPAAASTNPNAVPQLWSADRRNYARQAGALPCLWQPYCARRRSAWSGDSQRIRSARSRACWLERHSFGQKSSSHRASVDSWRLNDCLCNLCRLVRS
jgi:hypothetical protein